jgi:hypothetical protein
MKRALPFFLLFVLLLIWGLGRMGEEAPVPQGAGLSTESVGSAEPPPAGLERAAAQEAGRTAVDVPVPAQEPSEPTVQLIVRTAAHYGRGAPVVPRIEFELRRSDALRSGPPLFRGRTDDQGQATVQLTDDQVSAVLGRVLEPGYQQRTRGPSRRKQDASGPYGMTLMCRAGCSVRGRVEDERGAWVQSDVRWLLRKGPDDYSYGVGTHDEGQGWFRLDLDPGRAGTGLLLAEAGPAGTGVLGDVLLDPNDPPQDLRIVVHGAGAVRGRVTDGEGVPAANLQLLVLLAELDEPNGSFVLPEPLGTQRKLEGRGRIWATLNTGADGGFEATGLRSEDYVVRARIGDSGGSYPELLTDRPVPADGDRLDLNLSRPHIAVSLVDSDGEPLAAGEVEASFQRYSYPTSWPSSPAVLVYSCGSDGRVDMRHPERGVGQDPIVFELPPGWYAVGAIGGGFDGSFELVEVSPGSSRHPVTLRAAPFELGTVQVSVTAGAAELRGEGYAEPDFDLTLEHLGTGAVLLTKSQYRPKFPLEFQAPPGRYRIEVRGEPFIDDHHGTLITPRSLGQAEAEVLLIAGQTVNAQLEITRGAHLTLSLEGQANQADRRAAVDQNPWLEEQETDQVTRYAGLARVELRTPGRRPETVYHIEEWEGSSAAGTHRTSGWALGETDTSQMVSAGTYALVARLPGGREVEREVRLEPGQTVRVELKFQP